MWASISWARLYVTTLWTIEREFDGRLLLITRKTSPKKEPQELLSLKAAYTKAVRYSSCTILYTCIMKIEQAINWNFDEHIYVMQFPIIYLILLHPFSHHTTFYLWGKWSTRFDPYQKIHLSNISVISLSFLVPNSSCSLKFSLMGTHRQECFPWSSLQNQFYVVKKEIKDNNLKVWVLP